MCFDTSITLQVREIRFAIPFHLQRYIPYCIIKEERVYQFDQHIEDCRWRLAALLQHTGESRLPQKQLVTESLDELGTALKELQVVQEELRHQNEELAAARSVLESERQRYQELFEFAPDGYLVTDAAGVIQEANQAAATLLNAKQQVMVGLPLVIFVAAAEQAAFEKELPRLRQLDRVKDWELRLKPQDAEAIDAALSVAVVRNQSGAAVALRWLIRDITQRKQMEAALYQVNSELFKQISDRRRAELALIESEQRFRSLIENALDIITVLGSDGRVNYASPSVERVLGYKPAQVVGMPALEYIHPEDVLNAIYTFSNVLLHPGMALAIELRIQHQDGSWRMLEAISQKFIDPTGVKSVVVNCRDISERQRVSEIRQALEKEKELSQLKLRFFSLASHEFRTPLSTILVSAQLLQHANDACPQAKRLRNVQRIEAAAKHMTQLLDDILTINRAETGKLELNPKRLDLAKFCGNLVAEMRSCAGSQYTISFTSAGSCHKARVDAKLLRSILANLLDNAIKYSPQGGHVDFALVSQQGHATFRIRDQGIGIVPEDLHQLFEPFHRGKNVGSIAGTGLGLTVVKKCVELHAGRITFSSEVGVGTTSTVTLPLNLSS